MRTSRGFSATADLHNSAFSSNFGTTRCCSRSWDKGERRAVSQGWLMSRILHYRPIAEQLDVGRGVELRIKANILEQRRAVSQG